MWKNALLWVGVFISDLNLSHKTVRACVCVWARPCCSCCCCRWTWTTVHLYELIHCLLQQPLVPLRLSRPCKTGILCWMSNTNELLNILTLPRGKRQQGLMEQFHSVVVKHKQCQFSWMETGLYHRMTVNHLVDEIYFKSLAVNNLISQYFFLYLPICSELSDKRDGLFCLSWLSISPAL